MTPPGCGAGFEVSCRCAEGCPMIRADGASDHDQHHGKGTNMKPVQTIIAIIALGVLLLPSPLATVARAAEHPGGGQSGKSMVGHMALEVEVTGENICLGCTLKKEKGAQPQCSTYGHQNVLRVERLVAGGRDLSTAKGWLPH